MLLAVAVDDLDMISPFSLGFLVAMLLALLLLTALEYLVAGPQVFGQFEQTGQITVMLIIFLWLFLWVRIAWLNEQLKRRFKEVMEVVGTLVEQLAERDTPNPKLG